MLELILSCCQTLLVCCLFCDRRSVNAVEDTPTAVPVEVRQPAFISSVPPPWEDPLQRY